MVVKPRRESSCTVLQIVGDLDSIGAPRLRAAVDQAFGSDERPHIVLDLTQVPFCDSVGLGVLVTTLNRVRQAHGRLVLVLGPGMISNLLTITNLDGYFDTAPSVPEALATAA
ncbi:STAS domain-containing protein [Thermoactinospora rubra]|uniref:STAS domain-containing protein n=1 Tax=Thermoactinospora rubra TaxID=1088767 RepID=UPI000A11BC03|nr:STAS domain-containing protein [Thermoactinospora rubra]